MIKLEEKLPLNSPLGLAIDPSNLCNFECKFCPTGYRTDIRKQRENGQMSLDLFKKIINDCKSWNIKIDNLKLWKDGEPFANKNIIEMIKIARDSECFKKITITTNGILMDRFLNDLVSFPPDLIIVSILSMNEKDYKLHSRDEKNLQKVIDILKKLHDLKEKTGSKLPQVNPKICSFPGISKEMIDDFFLKFNPISNKPYVVHEPFNWDDSHKEDLLLGYDENKRGKNLKICPYPFYSLQVNFNGLVGVCCVDWSHKIIVGDLKSESLKDIWFGEKLKELKYMWRKDQAKSHDICGKCNFYKNLPDYNNIDEYVINSNNKLDV